MNIRKNKKLFYLLCFFARLPFSLINLIKNIGLTKALLFFRFCITYYIFVFLKRKHKFPKVLLIAVTGKCNLTCKECFIHNKRHRESISTEKIQFLLDEAEENKTKLVGLTGGEPFTNSDIVMLVRKHPSIYFFIFTNALLINESMANEISELKNIVLLIGIDGPSSSTAKRRGINVYENLETKFNLLRKNKIPFGITVMTTSKNIQSVTDIRWLREIRMHGTSFVLFVQYTPSGRNIQNDLILDTKNMELLKNSEVNGIMKTRMLPLSMHSIGSVCPFRSGKGLYISENGEFGTCPALPFSNETIDKKIVDVYKNSSYFRELKRLQDKNTVCLFRSNINTILNLVKKYDACSSYHLDLYESLENEYKRRST